MSLQIAWWREAMALILGLIFCGITLQAAGHLALSAIKKRGVIFSFIGNALVTFLAASSIFLAYKLTGASLVLITVFIFYLITLKNNSTRSSTIKNLIESERAKINMSLEHAGIAGEITGIIVALTLL